MSHAEYRHYHEPGLDEEELLTGTEVRYASQNTGKPEAAMG